MFHIQRVLSYSLRIVCTNTHRHSFPINDLRNNIKTFPPPSFNKRIEKKIQQKNTIVEKSLVTELRKITELDDDILLQIYQRSVSFHQANKQRSGMLLEESVLNILRAHCIPFKQQVVINENGFITNNREDCYYMIDIVVGLSVKPGDHISQHIVLSCKTTCRERDGNRTNGP